MPFEDNILTEDIRLNPQREMNQFIPPPRGFILYSGITVIALSVAIGLFISYLIQYPDIIEGPAEVRTLIPPIEQFSPQTNKIKHLLVRDGDTLAKSERIAILESEADFKDLDTIIQELKQFVKIQKPEDYLRIELNEDYNLGNLQVDYYKLINLLKELKILITEKLTGIKIRSIDKDISILGKLQKIQKKNIHLSQKESRLINKENKRKKTLATQGVISDSEMEKDSLSVLQQERGLGTLSAEVHRNEGQIINLQKQKSELIEQKRISILNKESELRTSIINLSTKIKEWRAQYELRAESNGVIEFKELLVPGLQLTQGQLYTTIIPTQSPNPIMCYTIIPSSGFGKLNIGQEAIIELTAYKKEEFGRIKAKVRQFTKLPQRSKKDEISYRVDLLIGDSLITDYNKALPINQNLEARVQIITTKRRLIERIFDKIGKVFEKRY